MEEIWKDVAGSCGRYKVSNLGNVKSMNGHLGEILMRQVGNCHGYMTVNIYTAPKKSRHMYVHRIVAEAFLDNPDGLKEVNHKNGNKADNRAVNLEWVSRESNIFHAVDTGLFDTKKKKQAGKAAKQVKCSNGKTYRSIYQASKELGIPHSSIRDVCTGKTSKSHDLVFSF